MQAKSQIQPKAQRTNKQLTNKQVANKQIRRQALAQVEWKDLRQLSQWQVAYNLILPFPFLGLSWWFASQSWFVLACLATYFFFASAFRQAHDGYHYSLGVKKITTSMLLILMSVLLLTSLHTIKATHMQHHRDPLGEEDIEGNLAKLSWWQALIGGVSYRLAIYREGFRLSNQRNRLKAKIEFGLIGMAVITSLALIVTVVLMPLFTSITPSLSLAMDLPVISANVATIETVAKVAAYHLIVMFLANALVGIIAVWGVHHDAEDSLARTERNKIINFLTFGLLFHVEHHLFPAVPTNHLPQLADRLDAKLPHLTQHRVTPSFRKVTELSVGFFVKVLAWCQQTFGQSCYKSNNKSNNKDNQCPIRRRLLA
ncbi:fatty acid desaturase [Psychrobacter lutiphocae]|uniref:fatty acid desaturase n=1 Tax=Psychrobacter lutiphocae TaxID=540500 RepID=UPI00035FA73A|nr:fatty acid desaturase [Psychrobacter lutiphocae]